MIVDILDVVGIAITPSKADAPLSVDSDAVLAGAVPSQLLQAIPEWRSQVLEGVGCVQHNKLPQHGVLKRRRKPPHRLPAEETLRVPVREAPNNPE